MKSNELRIGNYLEIDGRFEMVSSIHSDNTIRLRESENAPCHGCYSIRDTNIKFIVLNEEMLLKFGFIIENFDYTVHISECKIVWLTLIPQDEYCKNYSVCVTQKDEDEQNVFLSDISYVHQLQNLYFALTGEELTLK
jgi:hypothetical protein